MLTVTTTSTTTYSTTTTSTTQVEFDFCPDCPKNDTMIIAKKLDLAPIGNFYFNSNQKNELILFKRDSKWGLQGLQRYLRNDVVC